MNSPVSERVCAQASFASGNEQEAAGQSVAGQRLGGQAAKPVSLIGITKSYGDQLVLKPLNLEIRAGELLALLGPSGCGKTTTLRILAGFVSPDTGTVRIGGGDYTTTPPNRRGLGMVFQSYSLFPHMTVAQNVAFGLKMRKVSAADRAAPVRQMLEVVRLVELADRFPSQLSGGQQQRVALARALVTRPSVLLLDEPLAALDKNLRERMQFEIRDLQRRLGITTVLVTHDQEEAMTMSDRIAVMSQGELLQIGAPEEIYERPQTRFVSEFLGTSNIFEGSCAGSDERGFVRVRLDLDGTFASGVPARGGSYPEGRKVALMVRPEKLRLKAGASYSGIPCTVKSCIFRGSYYVYEVQPLGSRKTLVAFSQSRDSELGTTAGVTACWAPEDAVVLAN